MAIGNSLMTIIRKYLSPPPPELHRPPVLPSMLVQPLLAGVTLHLTNGRSFEIPFNHPVPLDVAANSDTAYADLLSAQAQGKPIDFVVNLTIRERG